jgi:Carboxypeptidase regulatory-like domain
MGISVILAVTVAFFPFAWAQTGSGNSARLRGTVHDANGRSPVANVRVIAISGSDLEETRTDANGHFMFFSLIPGDYRITAMKEGSPGPCASDRDAPESELSAGLEYSADVILSKHCSE